MTAYLLEGPSARDIVDLRQVVMPWLAHADGEVP